VVNSTLAAAARADIPRHLPPPKEERKPTDEVFGTKHVYSMQINLPNLTSAGGSWIIRFAEMTEHPVAGELSTPVATSKVDPAYPQALQQDGVQGVVVLYAVIHANGTVGEIRVIHGLHQRLDENAIKALSRWKFRPATKNGEPVDLEAVVQIPFYARRVGF
jgi:TonB family protein